MTGAFRDLTDGQRWTVGLVLAILVAFVSFGTRQADRVAASASPSATSEPLGVPGPAVASTTLPPILDLGGSFTPIEPVGETDVDGASPPIRVVALTRGADDASLAPRALGDLGVAVTGVNIGQANAQLCFGDGAHTIVVAVTGLGTKLRRCLVDAGYLVVNPDDLGDAPGALSTVLGARVAIEQAAQVATGRIGVVVASEFAAQAEQARASLAKRGRSVMVATVDSDHRPGVLDVVALLRQGVNTVVFAVPVAQQSQWLAAERTVALARFDHVVADVADAIENEAYSTVPTGARAVAATRLNWFARAHGETAAQQECRAKLGLAANAKNVNDGRRWCEVAAVVRDTTGASAVDSPASSPLGTRPDGSFGPTQAARLAWGDGCRCWLEARPFAELQAVA